MVNDNTGNRDGVADVVVGENIRRLMEKERTCIVLESRPTIVPEWLIEDAVRMAVMVRISLIARFN